MQEAITDTNSDPDFVFACFVSWLILEKHVRAITASCYVSHVINDLICTRSIPNSDQIRTAYLSKLLRGYTRMQAANAPARFRTRIPLHGALFHDALSVIETCPHYSDWHKFTLKAAFALGFALSLRPGEYLTSSPPIPLDHQADSSQSFLWFDEHPYNICYPHNFPPGKRADRFSVVISKRKNDQFGKYAGPRAVSRNPDSNSPFCIVRIIQQWVTKYPPPPHSPLLSDSIHGRINRSTISDILRVVAVKNNLDPSRLVPHSLRYAVIQSLIANNFDENTRQQQGAWRSKSGRESYEQRSLIHADAIAFAVHDMNAFPRSHITNIFSRDQTAVSLSDLKRRI